MRFISFTIWVLLAWILVWALGKPWGTVPAIGKLFSPSHGFWQQMEGEKPVLPEEVSTKNLMGSVEVVWDENLIPHVFALHDEDLYFVQGYITASMRLWQMDFQARAAAGRLSEIVGDVALDFDKGMRRMGMLLGAEKSLAAAYANPKVKMAFEKYAEGVNAYINSLNTRNLPLEYKLLDMKPEEWSPNRSMLLLLYMANMLNTFNNDIENTNFVEQFGLDAFAILFPDVDDKKDPIVDYPGMWTFPPIPRGEAPTDIVPVHRDMRDNDKPNPDNGSNNWAVAPQKTANGFAILANDPHLNMNLPALWFAIHLSSPSQNVMGASLPGTPAVVIGFNERIAWGFTNAQRDLVDYYKVTFTNNEKKAIVIDGRQESIKIDIQQIKSKSGKVVYDTLWYSSFGIIANYSQLATESSLQAYAYRWVGQEPSEVAVALVKLNVAGDMSDFLDATNHFHSPAQNIVFADVEGNIGIRVQGKFLPRLPYEGLFVRDGSQSANRWPSFIPNYQNISIFNPERGFVSSANQFPVDSTYPYYISANTWQSYRNRRINQLLQNDNITVDYVKQMHNDNYGMPAAESLPMMLKALKFNQLSDAEKEVYKSLKNWNYMYDTETTEAVYYEAWWDAVYALAWDEMDSAEVPMPKPSIYRTIKLLKEMPNLIFFDVLGTPEKEDATALIQQGFAIAMQQIQDWQSQNPNKSLTWMQYKNTTIRHLTRKLPLSVQQVPIGGNKNIVNATSQLNGPSWRQVVELKPNEVQAWGIYPGGQSGNPGSAFCTNWIEPWAKGEYITLDLYATPSTLYQKALANTTFNTTK